MHTPQLRSLDPVLFIHRKQLQRVRPSLATPQRLRPAHSRIELQQNSVPKQAFVTIMRKLKRIR